MSGEEEDEDLIETVRGAPQRQGAPSQPSKKPDAAPGEAPEKK